MSLATPRRSGRAPKPNPRYEDEVPWNDDTLRLLRADSDTSDASSTSDTSQAQPDPDVEMADLEMEDGTEDEEDMIISQTQDLPVEAPTPSSPPSEDDLPVRSKFKPTKSSFRMAKKDMYPQVFGPDLEDLYPVIQSRDMWHLNPRDLVFPSRATLKDALVLDAKGEYLERKQMEGSASVPPYHQRTEEISREEAITTRYLETGEAHDVVLGPSHTGKRYAIHHSQAFQIAQAWLKAPFGETSITDGPSIDNAYHKGWLLNLGARPQCLAWAPSSNDDQFLAVTFRCSKSQRDTAPPQDSRLAPAFSPSPAYPSRIEIWRIQARPGVDEEPAQLDHHIPPRPVQILCTRYGNILKMEWLTMANISSQPSLCILTSDGSIRLLNLNLVDRESPLYIRVKHPQFIANPPPNTIFTSFTLPNSHDLIASDAAGAIHLFSLLSDSAVLSPYSSLQIHMTYVTAITSIPSRPHYICTSSAAGEYILTDLRSPVIDRVRLQSARLPTRNLSYLPFTRTFLTTLDSASRYESVNFHGSIVVSHSLRDFKTNKSILRLPLLGGSATCLAASQFHPIIMVGNASGTVFTCNYLRRCLPIANAKKDKVGAWMVRLSEYEWRRLTKREVEEREKDRERGCETAGDAALLTIDKSVTDITTTPATNDANPPLQNPSSTPAAQQNAQQDQNQNQNQDQDQDQNQDQDQDPIDLFHGPSTPKPGISRFTEGYMPEKVVVSTLDTARSSTKSASKSKSKSKFKAKAKSKAKSKSKSNPRNIDTGEDDYLDDGEDDNEGDGEGGSGPGQAIYHEEQAVSSIAWNGNGNPRFASWVAVGWGSGIVRVCDLGHDVL